MCFDIHTNRHKQNQHLIRIEYQQRVNENLAEEPTNSCKILSNELLYICDYCADGFLTKNSLLEHFRSHKPKTCDNNILCQFCSNLFSSLSNLKKHIRRVHDKDKKLFSCDKCESKFPIFYDLASFIDTLIQLR